MLSGATTVLFYQRGPEAETRSISLHCMVPKNLQAQGEKAQPEML